ncbi:DUF6771 family protein [Sphingobium aquiterrae]|uniref:DUF6771 family protein n=1 Tax=Sphingobium aquiterrae TaxID=2038656 RepID=UPI00301A8A22|tara:strand:+ start:28814 stop:29044 length:231 start_codon:yes stop_codon:yes gene_type:complete
MDEDMQAIILGVIERAPQWIRHDLEVKDRRARARAEEALAAMIGNALKLAVAEPGATAGPRSRDADKAGVTGISAL